MTVGIKYENMDTTALPGTDFYQYACGGWIKNHPLTAEYARFGSFDELAENNRKQMRDLITGLAAEKHEQGTIEQKIGDLYNIVMDSVKLNADGMAPIKEELAAIDAVKDRSEIFPLMTKLGMNGVSGYFGEYIDADMKESSKNIFQLSQGGLSLGQKDYYTEDDEATKQIRTKYMEHIVKMFQLAGSDEAMAQKKMNAVLAIETRIAKASLGKIELRVPENSYHKMTVADFKKEYAGIDWDAYFTTLGIAGVQEINVGQPTQLKEVIAILNEVPVDDQKAYMEWKLIDAAAGCLSDDFVAQNFDFYGRTLSGRQEQSPRWKRAVSTLNSLLGEAVGQMYVQKYFPAAAKERMEALVKNLQIALKERILAQEWMSDTTKAKAVEKLDAFYVKVGYPNKWRDYSSLEITNDSYWANVKRASLFTWNKMVEEKFNKPVDKDEWYMTPQTVNAYYNPTTNEICFPAGILQYPFFDMNADDAFNYGAIGVVIGHEMTHGFDDQGRQFDLNGNLADWWTATDAENFKARTQVMVDFFNNISVLPDLKANGELTLGENIADHGGLNVAFQAFKNATKDAPLGNDNGFTPEQRFFLSYALLWAGNIRDEEIRNLTRMDPHSLGRWRVNGALPHIDAWYEAFGITENDPMFVPKENRVTIW